MNSPGHRTNSASTLSRFLLAPYTILVIVVVLVASKAFLWPVGSSAERRNPAAALRPRFVSHTSVRPSGPLNEAIRLSVGHDFLAGYSGPSAFVDALAQNKAEALSLASADF